MFNILSKLQNWWPLQQPVDILKLNIIVNISPLFLDIHGLHLRVDTQNNSSHVLKHQPIFLQYTAEEHTHNITARHHLNIPLSLVHDARLRVVLEDVTLQHIGRELQQRDGEWLVTAHHHLAGRLGGTVQVHFDLIFSDVRQCLLDWLAQAFHHRFAHVLGPMGRV